MNTYRFMATVNGPLASFETYPVLDEHRTKLVGGFTVLADDKVSGFVSGTGYEAALAVSSGSPFWFTVIFDQNRACGVVSERRLSAESQQISIATPL